MTTSEQVRRIDEILRGEGVEMSPPAPGIGDWLAALQNRVFEALDAMVPLGFDATRLARPLLWTLAAVGIFALGVFLVAALRTPRAPRRANGSAVLSEVPTKPRSYERDWRSVLESALERGDLAAALEATWWILLTGVAATPRTEDRSTGRSAVRAAGRTDLLPLVRELEALTYGRRPLHRAALEPLARRVCDSVA
ncbi:MAG: hypothetical protein AAGA81_07820 [Acidobacteriota bacterium]